MPVVQIEMYPRSVEAKRELAKELTEVFCRVAGTPPEAVHIIFRDMEKEDYAIAGVLQSEK